jgi:putative ABC transport system substrate-binding protein
VPFGDLAIRAVQKATTTIPIVAMTDDLVGAGLVASLARPCGNTTGVSILASELNVKRLELLKESVPKVSHVAAFWDPGSGTFHLKGMEVAAKSLAVQLKILEVRSPDDLARQFEAARKWHAEALNILASPLLFAYRKTFIDLAARSRLPAIYQWREGAEDGGLMSYGPTLRDMYQRVTVFVDKILKGTKPADLPVEQPTKFEFIINLKVAKQIGVTIPPNVLARADKVIK